MHLARYVDGQDYAGARRAQAGTYKGAAIPTPRATTTAPGKGLNTKGETDNPMNLPLPPRTHE